MTTTQPVTVLDRPSSGAPDLNHFYCHDPNRAYCGADLTDVPETDFPDDDPDLCVVCADLDQQPCPVCSLDGAAS